MTPRDYLRDLDSLADDPEDPSICNEFIWSTIAEMHRILGIEKY